MNQTNIGQLISQIKKSTNPIQMLTQLFNPQQKQLISLFQGKSNEEQAQTIADYCNKNNITKEQLQNIINMFSK